MDSIIKTAEALGRAIAKAKEDAILSCFEPEFSYEVTVYAPRTGIRGLRNAISSGPAERRGTEVRESQ